MAGTIAGGKKAAAKNLASDPNFYSKIGKIGGSRGNTGGFAYKELCPCDFIRTRHYKAMCAGKRGGMISRKNKRNMENI